MFTAARARDPAGLSEVRSRDRQTDTCPGLCRVRGILAAYSGKVIVYMEPGHLAFYAKMPSGRKGLRIVQTRGHNVDPVRPLRYQRSIGQTRSTVGTEPSLGEGRRFVVLGLALREPECFARNCQACSHLSACGSLTHSAVANIHIDCWFGDFIPDGATQAPAGNWFFLLARHVKEGTLLSGRQNV